MSDPTTKDDDTTFAANAATIRRSLEARVDAVKAILVDLITEQEGPGNGGAITLALLELGIERQLDLWPDEKAAKDLIEGLLRKVLQRRRGPVQ